MAKKLLTVRVWIFLIAIVLCIMAINPRPWASGVEIKGIVESSIESQQGFTVGEKIISVDNKEIATVKDYIEAISSYSSSTNQ